MANNFHYESLSHPELHKMTLPKLIAYYHAEHLNEEGKEDWYFYHDIAMTITNYGIEGFRSLAEEYKTSRSLTRKDASLTALWSSNIPETPEFLDLFLDALGSSEAELITIAIHYLRQTRHSEYLDRVLIFRAHPDGWVRGAVINFIGELFPRASIPMLIEAISDPHFVPREIAVDVMDEMEMEDEEKRQLFLPYFQVLLNDEHPDVRQAAETAIANLEDTYLD